MRATQRGCVRLKVSFEECVISFSQEITFSNQEIPSSMFAPNSITAHLSASASCVLIEAFSNVRCAGRLRLPFLGKEFFSRRVEGIRNCFYGEAEEDEKDDLIRNGLVHGL